MNRTARTFEWLNAVKADRRLTKSSCFKVAFQLAQKTNAHEFTRSGKLMTWQSIPTLAAAAGLSERTVRYALEAIQRTGHATIKSGHGPGQSNCYTLLQQKGQPVAQIAATRCHLTILITIL